MKALQSHGLRLSNNVDARPPMQDNDNEEFFNEFKDISKSAVLPREAVTAPARQSSRGVGQHSQAHSVILVDVLCRARTWILRILVSSFEPRIFYDSIFLSNGLDVRKSWESEGLGAHMYCVTTPSVSSVIYDRANHKVSQTLGKSQDQTIKKFCITEESYKPNTISSKAEAHCKCLARSAGPFRPLYHHRD